MEFYLIQDEPEGRVGSRSAVGKLGSCRQRKFSLRCCSFPRPNGPASRRRFCRAWKSPRIRSWAHGRPSWSAARAKYPKAASNPWIGCLKERSFHAKSFSMQSDFPLGLLDIFNLDCHRGPKVLGQWEAVMSQQTSDQRDLPSKSQAAAPEPRDPSPAAVRPSDGCWDWSHSSPQW